MRTKVSMFNDAQNIDITNSSVTVNVDASKDAELERVLKENLDRLFKEVSPNAILNAGGRADEVRCYPGTREEVIGKLEKWMDDEGSRKSRIMWLSGPAGAGKSAIFQTVAERSGRRGRHAANFFFFRGDGTRNSAQPLVATLVYQLRDFYPSLDELLGRSMKAKPRICNASVDEQFQHLVSAPFGAIQLESSLSHQPVVIIIDGLDECNDKRNQEQILGALHTLVEENNSPFLVLVASRAEHQLVMSFNKIGPASESIFLDSKYRPENDIRLFVITKFKEIKRVHPLAHTLGADWPDEADIDAITSKSSGQFIYAATVMRFIQYSPGSPALSLLTVHGMRPSTTHSPYAQLDAVYSYIFSQAQDIWAVKLILGAHFISDSRSPDFFQDLVQFAGFDEIEIKSFFADLVAIIEVAYGPPLKLYFYHASLGDYIRNKSRSGIYHVDEGEIAAELSSMCLKKIHDLGSLSVTTLTLSRVKVATTELSKDLLDASTRQFGESLGLVPYWDDLIQSIEKLYFQSDRTLFKTLLQSWVRFAYANNVSMEGSSGLTSATAGRYYKWYQAFEWVGSLLT